MYHEPSSELDSGDQEVSTAESLPVGGSQSSSENRPADELLQQSVRGVIMDKHEELGDHTASGGQRHLEVMESSPREGLVCLRNKEKWL